MEEIISGEGKKVCVTGASGFIASWLVKLLLERGYTVNVTVRSLKDPTKTEHLLGLDGAKERLHLFEADLLKEGSFDLAIQGCYGVFHTASPVVILPTNPEAEVIDPAVKGTLNVLGSCVKFPSVKRVIYMSSTEAVINNGRPLTNGTIVDETWFSTPEFCKGTDYDAYSISKTLAEATAWKFAKENEIDLVSMNPATVIGPILQPTLNLSSYSILNFINGSNYHPVHTYGYVHVKDVAEAHIKALETPSAKGRYILCETVASNPDIVEILRELYPSLKLPDKGADDLPVQGTYSFSQDKAKSLGIEYTPFKIAVKETVECLKDKFMISV